MILLVNIRGKKKGGEKKENEILIDAKRRLRRRNDVSGRGGWQATRHRSCRRCRCRRLLAALAFSLSSLLLSYNFRPILLVFRVLPSVSKYVYCKRANTNEWTRSERASERRTVIEMLKELPGSVKVPSSSSTIQGGTKQRVIAVKERRRRRRRRRYFSSPAYTLPRHRWCLALREPFLSRKFVLFSAHCHHTTTLTYAPPGDRYNTIVRTVRAVYKNILTRANT